MFNYLQLPKITCSGFITFLLLLLHAYYWFVHCCAFDICFLYIHIFYFCNFLWDPTWFCPGPIALSLPLLCADFLFLSLESNLSTCSLINRTCAYKCLYLYFSWKQPVNLLSHLQKLLCLEYIQRQRTEARLNNCEKNSLSAFFRIHI